jgi:hypothetical protein
MVQSRPWFAVLSDHPGGARSDPKPETAAWRLEGFGEPLAYRHVSIFNRFLAGI